MQHQIDENLLLTYSNTVSNRWLALRLEIIGNLITIFAALFAIFSRSTLSAGFAGKKKFLIQRDFLAVI